MCETRVREDDYGLNASQLAVDFSDVTLKFEVFYIADTTDNEFCTFALGEINGEVIIAGDTYAFLLIVKTLNVCYTLCRAESALLVDIETDSNDNLIKKGKRTLDNVGMADGERVKRPGENGYSHIVGDSSRM